MIEQVVNKNASENAVRSLDELVDLQVSMLRSGRPLEAFDKFYDEAVKMFANYMLFASGFADGRSKQEPYITAAREIHGHITDVAVFPELRQCVFRNRSRFTTNDGTSQQIDGLCCQKWDGDKIVEERHYDGEHMSNLLDDGILTDTTVLDAAFATIAPDTGCIEIRR